MTANPFSGKTLAVMLGGTAAERSISLESGENVARALELAGAQVLRVDTAEEGWPERLKEASFAFNLLHGPGGEDGTVQGLFELMKLPYSGCDLMASALTMDKVRTKWLWQGLGLPTPAFQQLTPNTHWQAVIEALGAVFVKPALEGSSLGMSKAGNAAELEAAYRHASTFGADVMAEQFVSGPEYTVAILGDRALPSIRIDVSGDFYDFDAKYHSEETQFTCPSDLTAEEEASLSELALAAFVAVGGEVWGRVDVMREAGGAWQLLEVNTVPGMTSHSLVPLAAKVAGLSLLDLLTEIYEHSLEVRHANQ
jgi:D-alanine-D-alanine ligase